MLDYPYVLKRKYMLREKKRDLERVICRKYGNGETERYQREMCE